MDRRQADVRRDEILRATARVVAQKGFARTRVADVAAVLGISSGLVFYHFETKERLLSEAFSAGNAKDLQTLEDTVAGAGSFMERLRMVMRLYMPTGSAEAWSRDIDAWSEGLYTFEIRQACRRNDERWRTGFATLIAEGVAAGECRCDDPEEAALRITVLLDGLAVASQVRSTLTRQAATIWAAEHTAQVLGVHADLLMPAPEDAGDPAGGDAADDHAHIDVRAGGGAGGDLEDPGPMGPRVPMDAPAGLQY